MADAKALFEWRNDPVTRAASHETAEIRMEDHLVWLEKCLADPHRKLYVAEIDGAAVGTVRADLTGGTWTLSWTVAPNRRGRGIGKRIAAKLAHAIADPIRAEVRSGNLASMRIAEHLGMQPVREVDGFLHYERGALPRHAGKP